MQGQTSSPRMYLSHKMYKVSHKSPVHAQTHPCLKGRLDHRPRTDNIFLSSTKSDRYQLSLLPHAKSTRKIASSEKARQVRSILSSCGGERRGLAGRNYGPTIPRRAHPGSHHYPEYVNEPLRSVTCERGMSEKKEKPEKKHKWTLDQWHNTPQMTGRPQGGLWRRPTRSGDGTSESYWPGAC